MLPTVKHQSKAKGSVVEYLGVFSKTKNFFKFTKVQHRTVLNYLQSYAPMLCMDVQFTKQQTTLHRKVGFRLPKDSRRAAIQDVTQNFC